MVVVGCVRPKSKASLTKRDHMKEKDKKEEREVKERGRKVGEGRQDKGEGEGEGEGRQEKGEGRREKGEGEGEDGRENKHAVLQVGQTGMLFCLLPVPGKRCVEKLRRGKETRR